MTSSVDAASKPEEVHFLIPGGAGGGWDGTARGVGKALVDSGIIKHASFENMSGGGGGKAMAGLLSGDTQVLSTGFSEAVGLANQGEIRILAVTSEKRLSQAPDVPTLMELGYDVSFANWRGFFGAPGLPEEKAEGYRAMLKKMYDTKEWEQIRSRRGWQNLYKPGQEFYNFLEKQEKVIGDLMRKLGFLK